MGKVKALTVYRCFQLLIGGYLTALVSLGLWNQLKFVPVPQLVLNANALSDMTSRKGLMKQLSVTAVFRYLLVVIGTITLANLGFADSTEHHSDPEVIERFARFLVHPRLDAIQVTAAVDESIETNLTLFQQGVFNGLIPSAAGYDRDVQFRSNELAFLLSGYRWRAIQETSDQCVHAIWGKNYSLTNVTQLLLEGFLTSVKTSYTQLRLYDPNAIHGYKMAFAIPETKSALTDVEGQDVQSAQLRLFDAIEPELTFVLINVLTQTNATRISQCNPLMYDFSNFHPNTNKIANVLASGIVKVSQNSGNNSEYQLLFKIATNMVVNLTYQPEATIPVPQIGVFVNGTPARTVLRHTVSGKPWEAEWFDDRFESDGSLRWHRHVYVLEARNIDIVRFVNEFDSLYIKSAKLRSEKSNSGEYSLFKGGSLIQKYFDNRPGRFSRIGLIRLGFVGLAALSIYAFFRVSKSTR